MIIRIAAFTILFFAAAIAAGQEPHQEWRTITTKHFRVHYPSQYELWATRAASRLESVRDAVVKEVGFSPEQVTDVLVVNPVAEPNGETIPLLDTPRILLSPQPPEPEDEIGEYSEWIDLVTVHETAHLVHLLRPSRNPVERFFERFVAIDPIVFRAPRWIFEGYATVIEGRITGSGRPSGSMRAAILRKWALEGRLPTYDQLDSGRRFLGLSMAYLMGSAFLEWLDQREGPDAMRHLWARLSARQRRSFDEAFIGVYGETPSRLYGEFVAQLTESAVALARSETVREGDLWQETSRRSGQPAVSPDGKSLAMVLRNEKGDARLVVFSTEKNPEEEKTAKRIETILRRDPEDVAPVRRKPLPREPLHTFVPPDGGDVEHPRWTRDGASIVYTHRQPDRDGVLHRDLFRWTPATGANVRITHLADVGDADPMPDDKRYVAVRDQDGQSQIVFVDGETGAVVPQNQPSIESVYSHPRAGAHGNIAFAEHRGGVWQVGSQLGAFAPEFGNDGALYTAVARGGFIDIARDGVPVTQVLGAAVDPAPSPDGSLYFMSLEPDGFVVRRLAEPAPAGYGQPASAERTYVPALPPPPAHPVALTSEPVTAQPYGIGRQEPSTIFGTTRTHFGNSTELGMRFGDVVGRLDTLIVGATGGGALPRGGALATVWRGWPVDVSAHLFRARARPERSRRGERGAELRGRWNATFPLSHVSVSAGTLALGRAPEGGRAHSTEFFEGAFSTHQRRIAAERLELAADSNRHLRVSARAGLRGGGFELVGELTGARRIAVGGTLTTIEPESLFIARIADPALDRDALSGAHYRGERIELRSGPLAAFVQRHTTDRTIQITGIEVTLARDPLPIVKAAGLDLTAGIARVTTDRDTRGWIAMRWRP